MPHQIGELLRMRSFSNPLTEYSPQMELASDLLQEFDGESEHGSFDAHQEMQLAIRLLEVADEEHLERFLDDLISQAGSETGNPSGSRVGQAMRRVVKTVIGQALAPGGAAIAKRRGGFLGAQLGCGLAAVSGEVLGLELEGLSGEDREFEAIRQFVRFAGTAARIAAGAAAAGDASAVAHRAAVEAARLHAPGLLIGGKRLAPRSGRRRPARQDPFVGERINYQAQEKANA